MDLKFDFSGWATRNDLVCADGRTIRHNAFEHCDGKTVPLVWNHQHNEPTNILGHALLENRKDGVYAYCTFNESESGKAAKELVQHGDIVSLSIYANGLQQTPNKDVMHGDIREVSLVVAGANPGAFIDFVDMAHGEGGEQEMILSAYAEAISNVKADVVTASANAAEALSNLASGLPDSSLFDKWFGGDQTLASFGGDISKFGAAMKDYYGQISGIDTGQMADVVAQVWSLLELAEGAAGVNTSGLTGFADSMRKMGDAGISGFTSAFYNCGDTVNKAVSSMLSTVSGAVLSNLPVTNGAMETVVQSLANIVDGKVPAIRTSTSDMMRTMEASITAHSRTVGDAMRTVLSTAVSNINRMKPEFETAGKNAGQGFINGINSKLGGARSAGRSLGLAALEAAKKALDSHSPSREFIHLGENVGEGLAIGVNNSIVPAAQAASGMIDEVIAVSEKGVDAFEDWINEKQYYGELSLMDELAGWENLQKKYRAGSEERMKIDREVYRVQNELVSATYQASLDWIEEEKYYKRLSTEEELAAYERMQARYLEGSKERMELDRKVFTLRNQLVDESYDSGGGHVPGAAADAGDGPGGAGGDLLD